METLTKIADFKIEKDVIFLNMLLADEYSLYTKTRNVHWNINRTKFKELHSFFEDQYLSLDVILDDTAEQVRSLGHIALGSLKDFLNGTHIDEESQDFNNPALIIQSLIHDHETIIGIIKNYNNLFSDNNENPKSNNFINGLMLQHEKMAWMLKPFLS
jgi:starvation-inducible DNA-binding protein